MKKKLLYTILSIGYLLSANTLFAFTHADTLRGSNGRGRDWWDVKKYWLEVNFDTTNQSINGGCTILFDILKSPCDSMQIDLQDPMIIDSVLFVETYVDNIVPALSDRKSSGCGQSASIMYNHPIYKKLLFNKDGNVWWVKGNFKKLIEEKSAEIYETHIFVYFHGKPRKAINPPWDGGFSWRTDSAGKPWIAVSCQGLGASVWWPCKDAQWDEPDDGMEVFFNVPQGLVAVGNGRFVDTIRNDQLKKDSWHWRVHYPINNYDFTFYIGDYVHWSDTVMGENGKLNLDFWVLRQNEAKARKQFAVVPKMIHAFEYWMGPYPFYEDDYKLVDAPYLGMEHQSAIAYGNQYKMGYLGYDRTATGIGMGFDYIIIHESGHEWFGNNVTAKDIADNWIHESITTYSESLFAEYVYGKEKGQKYCRGEWHNIENDKPIIGPYGVNEEGSNDMYDKGAAIMYMIRQLTNDDEKFRQMLRGLGKEFYHQTVTTQQVETYIATNTGLDLTAFFNQYLRQADKPVLEYKFKKNKLSYRFTNTVAGFTLPIPITNDAGKATINPTAEWQTIKWKTKNVEFSKDFYVKTKKI